MLCGRPQADELCIAAGIRADSAVLCATMLPGVRQSSSELCKESSKCSMQGANPSNCAFLRAFELTVECCVQQCYQSSLKVLSSCS